MWSMGLSVHGPILRLLLRRPFRTVIVDDTRAYRGVHLLAGALHIAEVIERQSRTRMVGLLLPTSGVFPMAALACWMLGRTVVPLNYLLARDELQYVIDDCEADTVLTVSPMLSHLGYEPRAANLVRLDALSFKGIPRMRRPARPADDDLAVLLYTSGTSGRPKGVMLSHGNLAANVDQIRRWVDFTRGDVMFGVLPQFHSFGLTVLTIVPLTLGMRVVYAARFVPQRIVRALREHRPTVFVAIPSMYNALLQVKDAAPDDFASLRYKVSGGEPLPDAVADRFRERFNVTINEGYGLTETAPVTNWCRPHEHRPHSVGRPLPGVEERIVDPESGRVLPHGQDGEVRIRGPNVMRGYFKLPDLTREAFDADGFFRTGDMGRFDADGHLYITGRIKEMLIVGGENVFPREIEEVLDRHPSVAASAVVGVQDPIRGEVPAAFVELREGQPFDADALVRWCREHLAGYKVPREIHHVDALPRSPTGKILRRQLKARAGAPSEPPTGRA